MINKLKLGFLIAILSLAVGVGYASAANVNFTTDTTANIIGNNYTIGAGSSADTVVANAGTLVVTITAPSTFTFSSPDGQTITATDELAATSVQTCANGVNSITYTAVGGPHTLTITPSADIACEQPSSGGGSSHSGGGGGGGSNDNDNDVEVAASDDPGCVAGNLFSTATGDACSNVVVGCGSGNAFSPVTGQSCGTSGGGNTTIVVGGSSGSFSYDFGLVTVKRGSSGAFCRAWQNFFNNRINAGLVVDGLCGPLTMAAARTWQASAGLVADGLLGPKSRAAAYAQAAAEVR